MAIKVIYFNMGGRAEPIRLALHYAGVQFEDVRLTGAEFGEKKAAGYFKFGQVPVVEIDGKQFAQSAALLTWAGKHSDLYPQDPIQALKVDEALGLLSDCQAKLISTFPEQDPVKKAELRKNYVEKEIPIWFGYAEKLLKDEGTGFFAGTSPSIAGLSWFCFIKWHESGTIDHVPTNIVDGFPHLKQLCASVKANPKIADYYTNH